MTPEWVRTFAELGGMAITGLAVIFTMRAQIALLIFRVVALEAEVKVLSEKENRYDRLDERVLHAARQIEELRHGRGFIKVMSTDG